MLTAQTLVAFPRLSVDSELVELEMFSPDTSTGPRMYLNCASSSHVTNGTSGSATLVFASLSVAQEKLVNWSPSAGVTQLRSLAFVGLTLGVASRGGAFGSLGEGDGVSGSPSAPTSETAAASVTSTGRNSSFAEDWIRSRVC